MTNICQKRDQQSCSALKGIQISNFTLRKYEDLRYCTGFPVQIYIYQCYKKSIKLSKTMELNRRPQHHMALNFNP